MLQLEQVDQTLLRVEPLSTKHLPDMQTLWTSQYLEIRKQYPYLPQSWLKEPSSVSTFLEQQIQKNKGAVVTYRHTVIGFMTYGICDFHGEKTAFFPILAHAVDPAYTVIGYSTLYNHLSQALVEQGCLNHIVIFFSCNQALQTYLFEVGFGLYVVDAYRDLRPLSHEIAGHAGRVRQATREDRDELFALVKESDAFYASAPLFLKRESETPEELLTILTSPDHAVFVATENNVMIGYLNIRCEQKTDVWSLSDPTTGMIDPLGAYIKPEYRGRGIGKHLLHEAITWARHQEVTTIHVDFESANYYANQFWPKYFTSLLSSVKRHLNSDAGYK